SAASSMSKALSRSTALVVSGSRIAAARKAVSVAVPAATGRRCCNARRVLPIETRPRNRGEFSVIAKHAIERPLDGHVALEQVHRCIDLGPAGAEQLG